MFFYFKETKIFNPQLIEYFSDGFYFIFRNKVAFIQPVMKFLQGFWICIVKRLYEKVCLFVAKDISADFFTKSE